MRMSSCISNFRRRAPFLAAIATTFTVLLGVDVALRVYVVQRTTANRFIDNKDSKFRHYLAQPFPRSPDAVFIGSSLTKNHISTDVFRGRGWVVYNMGISGRLLGDYPSMAENALRRNPRVVVLNLSASDLLTPPSSEFTHFTDLLAQWRAGLPWATLLSSAGNFLEGRHLLHYYRAPLYENVAASFRRLAPPPAAVAARREDRAPAFADQVNRTPDCDVFKRATYDSEVVLTCTNGDGVQLGRFDPSLDPIPDEPPAGPPNESSLRLLREVVAEIGKSAKPIVVIQPSRRKSPPLDIKAIEARIGAPLIDLRTDVFSNSDWSDGGHFNLFGREKYSKLLESALRPYLQGG